MLISNIIVVGVTRLCFSREIINSAYKQPHCSRLSMIMCITKRCERALISVLFVAGNIINVHKKRYDKECSYLISL